MPDKITLYKIKKPEKQNLNSELQWFSQSLGLFNKRDKEKSCFRIFIVLVEAKKIKRFFSSDEIADKSNLTRATVIHHLKNLEEHGLIRQENKRYSLSNNNLSLIIKNLESEIRKTIEDLKEAAEELDKKLEI